MRVFNINTSGLDLRTEYLASCNIADILFYIQPITIWPQKTKSIA